MYWLTISLTYLWHIVVISLAYLWHIFGISLAYLWHIFGIFLAYLWHIFAGEAGDGPQQRGAAEGHGGEEVWGWLGVREKESHLDKYN